MGVLKYLIAWPTRLQPTRSLLALTVEYITGCMPSLYRLPDCVCVCVCVRVCVCVCMEYKLHTPEHGLCTSEHGSCTPEHGLCIAE